MSSSEAKPAESVTQADKKSHARGEKPAQKRFQPKLNTVEDQEAKTCLVKINKVSFPRQIIGYCLTKLRNGWRVELNAFSQDIDKAMVSTETMKEKLQFLHQETKIITNVKEVPDGKNRSFTGLSIVLSKEAFEVSDQAGY